MARRAKIPAATETELFCKSGRRCAICFRLHGDTAVKPGQIAHLDGNASNTAIGNLCFLCQLHHDQYDSRTSQTKGLTEHEVRSYRDSLYAALPTIVATVQRSAGSVDVSADISAGSGQYGPGGNARVEGGTGRNGASGGNVRVGQGTYRGGDGGLGKGGDLIVKGGDVE